MKGQDVFREIIIIYEKGSEQVSIGKGVVLY